MTPLPIENLVKDPVARARFVEQLVGLSGEEWEALGRAARRLGADLDPFREALLDLMLRDSAHPLPSLGPGGALDSPFIRFRDDAIVAIRGVLSDDPEERRLEESALRKVTEIVHLDMFLTASARSMVSERERDEPLPMVAALCDGMPERRPAA